MAKGKKVTTSAQMNGSSAHGRKGGTRGLNGQVGEVWPLEVAMDMLCQSLNSIDISGKVDNRKLPRVGQLQNAGTVKAGQAPRVIIAIEGVYYCPNCHALTFADSVANAKCERCNAES